MKRMRVSFTLSTLFLGICGCATIPPSTGYTPAASLENYGYYIKPVKTGSYIAVYRGNSQTGVGNAFAYTILAAYEQCAKQQKVAWVSRPENLTQTDTRTRVGSYSLPYYNSNGTTSYSTQVYSYDVTDTYPNFLTVFWCRERFKDFAHSPKLENIKAELVHDVTKDFHGGLIVKSIEDQDKGKPFLVDDVLIRINNDRVEDPTDVGAAFEKVQGNRVAVAIIRDHQIIKISAPVIDLTEKAKEIQTQTTKTLCTRLPQEERENAFSERPVVLPGVCSVAVKKP